MSRICPQRGCNNSKQEDMFNCWKCNSIIHRLTKKEEMAAKLDYIKSIEIGRRDDIESSGGTLPRGFGVQDKKVEEPTKGPIKYYLMKICLYLRILRQVK